MKKKEWLRSSSALRALLRELKPIDRVSKYQMRPLRRISYTFGALYHPEDKMWYVYAMRTNNCLATIRFLEERQVVVRYRKNSWYADTLREFRYEDWPVMPAPADLSGRRKWLREGIRPYIERDMQEKALKKPVRPSTGITTAASSLYDLQREAIQNAIESVEYPSLPASTTTIENGREVRYTIDRGLRLRRNGRYVAMSNVHSSVISWYTLIKGRHTGIQIMRRVDIEASMFEQYWDHSGDGSVTLSIPPVESLVEPPLEAWEDFARGDDTAD